MISCKHCGFAIEIRDEWHGNFWRHVGSRLMACNLDDPESEFAEPADSQIYQ